MDTATKESDLLFLLKTLADETRLTMIGLMSDGECSVGDMAGLLDLSEPTVLNHASKMHGAGLLHLRMADKQHYYRLNRARLVTLKAYIADIDAPPSVPEPSDNAWIDALDWDAADKKVLCHYTFNGRLTEFPISDKNWMVILRWLATQFEPGVRYSERQVNAALTQVHEDYASLRRNLVEYGLMQRERGGGDYWRTPEREGVEADG